MHMATTTATVPKTIVKVSCRSKPLLLGFDGVVPLAGGSSLGDVEEADDGLVDVGSVVGGV